MNTELPPAAPTFPKFDDPNYVEPTSIEQFKARIATFGTGPAQDEGALVSEAASIVADLMARVEVLTSALMPFASHAMALSNMQMCLTANGRPNEPPGGTWVNGVNSAQLQPNPVIFYLAADAVGRAAVEARLLAVFNKIQEANAAAIEKAAHVEDATLVGPVGGPVEGQVH